MPTPGSTATIAQRDAASFLFIRSPRPMTFYFDDDASELVGSPSPDMTQEEYCASVPTNEQIEKEEAENPRRRGAAKNYGKDGVVDTRMSQTEVALRLARHLAESPLFRSNTYVRIGGAEVNRRGDDVTEFAVKNHLSRWGFTQDPRREGYKPEWVGFYTSGRTQRKLLVKFDKFDGHIMAFFATGHRLIVHCTGGNVGNTRSPAEHHDLHRAIGRAICWNQSKPDDVIAVCTPRSERFRKMTADRIEAVGVKRSDLRFLHVDRGGGMLGLDALTPAVGSKPAVTFLSAS